MMILILPAASIQAALSASGSAAAAPFKLFVIFVLTGCVVRDLLSNRGGFASRVHSWFRSFSAVEYIAFALGLLALFNSIVVNRLPAGKCFNEAGGFLLAAAGIGSFLRRQDKSSLFVIRLLWVMALLGAVQLLAAAVYARQSVIQSLFYSSNMVEYIKTSWEISRFFSNPNTFGFIMMTGGISGLSLIVSCLKRKLSGQAAAALFCTVLCLFGMLLSASRASMLGFFVALSAVLIIPSSRRPLFSLVYRHPYLSLSAAVLAAGAGFFFFRNHFFLLSQKFDNGTIYRSAFWSGLISDPNRFGAIDVVTANRYSYWKGFLAEQVRFFPSLDFFFGKADYKAINPVNPGMELHNVYLEMWGKYGILCSLGLAAFLSSGFFKVFSEKKTVFLAGIPLAFMAHGLFEDKIFINSLHPQMLFLYCVLLSWLVTEKGRADSFGRVS